MQNVLRLLPSSDEPLSEGRFKRPNAFLAVRQVAVFSLEIVGKDCPGLSSQDLRGAFAALAAGADVVLGPAEDGGYVLIGVRCCSWQLFSGICWGSDQMLQ
ncbi:DUF2064 domain-containing protein [Nitrosococcus oceani]|uniref:DUF2064 domain-containing protein n=1 Tax=Nitrosococcus oceani TaxID=1229 RepID=UPI00211B918F|nr:DUF2064 domain-containing protein [Nitrosococcus oceani]